MNTAVHFSSATDLWSTPQDFYDKLNEEFHFTLDVCATPENATGSRLFALYRLAPTRLGGTTTPLKAKCDLSGGD
jgi:hypothetical protein